MKKALILSALALSGALALASCNTAPPPAACSQVVTLENARVEIGPHKSLTYFLPTPGVIGVRVEWEAGQIKGSDWVHSTNTPDAVGLGCADGVKFTQAEVQRLSAYPPPTPPAR